MKDKKVLDNIARMIPVESGKNPEAAQVQRRLQAGRDNFNQLVKSVFSSVMKISALDLMMRDCTERMAEVNQNLCSVSREVIATARTTEENMAEVVSVHESFNENIQQVAELAGEMSSKVSERSN